MSHDTIYQWWNYRDAHGPHGSIPPPEPIIIIIIIMKQDKKQVRTEQDTRRKQSKKNDKEVETKAKIWMRKGKK